MPATLRAITLVAAILLSAATDVSLPAQRILYVDDDATGLNDGSSWKNAFVCLQNALAAGVSGDEIRVAQGIYTPDRRVVLTRFGQSIVASADREESFQLKAGVVIRGGYAGLSEPDPHLRDVQQYGRS